jgi:RNA polymerase sigma-70 factor (ECF subfamily)
MLALEESDPRRGGDEPLLRAAQAGDRAALEKLLKRHERALFALCYGILAHADDAEDAVQETFFRALRALPRFEPGQATFRTWLFRIAVNLCLNQKRDRRPTEPWDEEHRGAGLETTSPAALALARIEVTDALSRLPPRQRAIFLLRVLEGWSLEEIARAMGWNRVRVKNELSKARRTLAEYSLAGGQARGGEGAEP